jgi:hypothetical protein
MENEEVLTREDLESNTFETRKLFWRLGTMFYNGRFIGPVDMKSCKEFVHDLLDATRDE